MAISNKEKQQRFYAAKTEAGESKISCWLPEDDSNRLKQLSEQLGFSGKGKKLQGYSEVISLALKELEINLTPPAQKAITRYGLLNMNNSRHR